VQPSEEQIRKLEARIREIEKDVRAGERELGRQGDRSVLRLRHRLPREGAGMALCVASAPEC